MGPKVRHSKNKYKYRLGKLALSTIIEVDEPQTPKNCSTHASKIRQQFINTLSSQRLRSGDGYVIQNMQQRSQRVRKPIFSQAFQNSIQVNSQFDDKIQHFNLDQSDKSTQLQEFEDIYYFEDEEVRSENNSNSFSKEYHQKRKQPFKRKQRRLCYRKYNEQNQLKSSSQESSEKSQNSLDKAIKNIKNNRRKRTKRQQCPICFTVISTANMIIFSSQCNHSFCVDCVIHYMIEEINNFKEIKCLQQSCYQILPENAQILQKLTIQQRQRYYRILIFKEVIRHGNRRLCPDQRCQGYLIIDEEEEPASCVICGGEYCSKCFLSKHLGKCSESRINCFDNNYRYKRCQKCKFVVEKQRGCNHMTCRCGYQFCYMCSNKWSNNHQCSQRNSEQHQKYLENSSSIAFDNSQLELSISSNAQKQRQRAIDEDNISRSNTIVYVLLLLPLDLILTIIVFLFCFVAFLCVIVKACVYSYIVKSIQKIYSFQGRLKPCILILCFLLVIPMMLMWIYWEITQILLPYYREIWRSGKIFPLHRYLFNN